MFLITILVAMTRNSAHSNKAVHRYFSRLAAGVLILTACNGVLASVDYEDFEKFNGVVHALVPDFAVTKPLSATAYVNGSLDVTEADGDAALSGVTAWAIAGGEVGTLKFAPGAVHLNAFFQAEDPNAVLRLCAYDSDDQLIAEKTVIISETWQHLSMDFMKAASRIELENFSNGKIRLDDLLTHRLEYTPEALAERQIQSRLLIALDPATGVLTVNVGSVSVRVGDGVSVQVGNLVSVNVGNGVSVQVGSVLVDVGNGVRVVIGGKTIVDTGGLRDGALVAPTEFGAAMTVQDALLFFVTGLGLLMVRLRDIARSAVVLSLVRSVASVLIYSWLIIFEWSNNSQYI